MRRAFVGRRGALGAIRPLRHLGFHAGETFGQLHQLTGELKHLAVLLFDVSLKKSQAFFQGVHGGFHKINLLADDRSASHVREVGRPKESPMADTQDLTKVIRAQLRKGLQ